MKESGVLSPQEVRNILNTDNKEIVELCKRASILPKKDQKGQTYFSYDEVKHLRQVQAQKNLPVEQKNNALSSILSSLKSLEDSFYI